LPKSEYVLLYSLAFSSHQKKEVATKQVENSKLMLLRVFPSIDFILKQKE
jgi:hypothetical protein